VVKSVLFICTHNSARSQMAEGLLRALHGDLFEVSSAGTEPRPVHPVAVRMMAEIGIDISLQRPKDLGEFMDREFDYVVSVCSQAQKICPFFPGGRHCLHATFDDPSDISRTEEAEAVFRRVRDEIRGWIETEFMQYVQKSESTGE
jgi:arsenate reductase (thioredoxin)